MNIDGMKNGENKRKKEHDQSTISSHCFGIPFSIRLAQSSAFPARS